MIRVSINIEQYNYLDPAANKDQSNENSNITKKTPMQYAASFKGCKNGNFQIKNCDIMLIVAKNIVCVPTVYVLEQNKKIMYTPVNPSFTI